MLRSVIEQVAGNVHFILIDPLNVEQRIEIGRLEVIDGDVAVVDQKPRRLLGDVEFRGEVPGGGAELRAFASAVKSGDPDNRESAAARIYFDSYMPDTTRQEDNAVNAALNYGYAIMRGAVARSLTSYGFLCAVGIHHRNELNAFNLADDFMEVLRPVVDLWTARNVTNGSAFTIKERAELAALLGAPVVINFERQKILRAIDIMCASFSTASAAGDASALKLPELIMRPKVQMWICLSR